MENKEKELKETEVQTPAVERVRGYTVWENADGTVDVEPQHIEEKEPLTNADIYEHITSLSSLIDENKKVKLIRDVVTESCYYAVRRALMDHQAMMDQQAKAAEAAPTVEE